MIDKKQVRGDVEHHVDRFLETKNFAYAMSAFCHARTIGDPVPEVILKHLDDAFRKWTNEDGEKSLDEILGAELNSEHKKQRDEILLAMMARLIVLGWSVSDAAEGACGWARCQYAANTEKYFWFKPSKAGKERSDKNDANNVLAASSIHRYWKRCSEAQRDNYIHEAKANLQLWTEEEKKAYQNRVRTWMGK